MSEEGPSIYFPVGGKDYGRNKYTGRRFHPPWASGQFETPDQKRAYISMMHSSILNQARSGDSKTPRLEELQQKKTADLARRLQGFAWKKEVNLLVAREIFQNIQLVDEKSVMESLREWTAITETEYDQIYIYLRQTEAEVTERKILAYKEAVENGWVPKPDA